MNNKILKEDVQQFAENFEFSDKLENKVFLITGVTGLIGSVFVKCILELNRYKKLNIQIISIVRDIDKAYKVFGDDFSEVQFLQMQLSEISTEKISTNVDYIVHFASPTASNYFVSYPVETLQTSIYGTNNLLEFAKIKKIKSFVYASSLEVYGSNQSDEWISEDFQGYVNPLNVRSSYSLGKRICECLCHSYTMEFDVPVKIARLTQTFGAGVSENDNRVFSQFAKSVLQSKDIELHTEGHSAKPYCYTIDAISAILYILLKGEKGEAYNIANKDSYITILDMALFLRDNFNPAIDVVVNINNQKGYAPETRLKLDTRKIEKLGWKPQYSLHQMYYRLLEYFK